jgi:DNA-binding GntR family transcriptional regulator
LAELGLVERKPGNGWSFLPFINSSATQRESYQLRTIVEPGLLLLPSFSLDQDWAQKIRARHIAFRKLDWRDTMAVEFYEMNADFHEGLARASGNRYIVTIIQQQNRLRQFSNYTWDYGVKRVHNSISEHLAILAALQDGKRDLAAALMKEHLENARRTHPEKPRPSKVPEKTPACC